MNAVEALVEQVRREFAPEPRIAIFEVRVDAREDGVALTGVTTEPAAARALLERVARLQAGRLLDEIVRLPDPSLGEACWGLVRAAIAPVHVAPSIRATQTSQYVMGARVELLARSGPWLRVRGEDGYIGWVNQGYLRTGARNAIDALLAADGGTPVVSLGARLEDAAGRPLSPFPWGARAIRMPDGRLRLPDGRQARLGDGRVAPAASLLERFPARGPAIVESARLWLGAPYVWGGGTHLGVDCSGFVQAIYALHGVRLPRDSELQARTGAEAETGEIFAAVRAGDLLFFTEVPGHITHVALSMGGPRIIHSSLSNGGVAMNDLGGEHGPEPALREMFVVARRVLRED